MKIISTSPSFAKYSKEPIEYLHKYGIQAEYLPANMGEDEFINRIQEAEGLIVAFTQINSRVLDNAPKLKIICKHGVGVDNIDLEEARKRNIYVTNVPNANKHAVADFAFGLVLSAARQIPQANELTKKGKWPRIFGTDVYGKTIGIIGLGNIGKQVALRAKGFNMRVLAYDPYPDREFAGRNEIEFLSFEELLKQSDFVTIHIPLVEKTKNLIDLSKLKLMKSTAYLINASRGGIVAESDLYRALKEKIISGAAIDVFSEEPVKTNSLFELPNFIASPHIAGYTAEAVNALGMTCVENIINVLIKKSTPNFIVNGL
ncbi:phosphoglycerate dehydrogenase [Clostridium sp. WLY-B-L2]|uniref:Phosphoglycerate dehydrogenase n=1 Tax=Clostridium aromativorans TaxID=2836848 RepID=A0ABS8N5L2_9CLOT|nr:phosphoglycerate dehydrogenase [Clostridium aromativorans]MCC9295092.1 phosphoglycerate dehydrogenase [Clostridium aromativorans]